MALPLSTTAFLKPNANETDIMDVVNYYVSGSLKKQGSWWITNCPFPGHPDHNPSFGVNTITNVAKCFSCGRGGKPIKFVMDVEGWTDYAQAARKVEEIIGYGGRSFARPSKPTIPPKLVEPKEARWDSSPKWQEFAETQLAAARSRMHGEVLQRFTAGDPASKEPGRGLIEKTVRYWEVGYTGEQKIVKQIDGRWLIIPAKAYIFPRRAGDGRIQSLKWRNTDFTPRRITGTNKTRKPPKYEQLSGSDPGMLNLAAAIEWADNHQHPVVLAKGEFEVMLMWQIAGIEATCAGSETATVDFTVFGDREIIYIGDNDGPGRQAAKQRQLGCDSLTVTYPLPEFKDLTEQYLGGKLQGITEIKEVLDRAHRYEGRRKTRRVKLQKQKKTSLLEGQTVELDEARQILARETAQLYEHPRRFRKDHDLLHLAAQPGVGKGRAANDEATRRLASSEGKTRTLWLGPRVDMFSDQPRNPNEWKQILGRQAAVDQDGNRVDFNSKEAVIPGNCTAQGEKYHETMAAKGWERKSHEYCQQSCPLLAKCEEKGYLSQFKNDGRNAYATFAHLFTSTPEGFHAVVVDEPGYKDFVRIDEVQDADLWHLLGFTFNWGMSALIKALRYLLQEVQSHAKGLDLAFDPAENEEFLKESTAVSLSGIAFYTRLDEICKKLFGQNRNLLELIRLAENAGGWYNNRVSELLDERTVEAADKLPPNLWQPEGMVPAPGMGGLYDVIKEESGYALSGLFAGQPFASRLELVKEGGNSRYKKSNQQSQAKLVLHRRRYPTAELSKKALIVLDGTGDSQLLKTLFTSYENLQPDRELKKVKPIWARRATPRVKTIQPVVELPSSVSVIQDTSRNYSMSSLLSSLKKDPARRYWGRYVDSVMKYLKPDGKRTLIVCASKVEQELAGSLVVQGISEPNGYHYALAHYGGLRGSNEFEDYDRVILAGMYMVNPGEVVKSYRALFASPDEGEFDTLMLRRARLYSLEKDGEGFSDDVMEFRHEGLQQLMNTVSRDEMVQALHRIRPIGATGEKEIVLLMGLPLEGVPVKELFTDDGTGNLTNERSHRTLADLVAAARRLLSQEGKSYFTVAELAEESGRKLGETIYKYFKQVARLCGTKAYGVECVQKLKNGGLRLRTFTVAVHASVAELAENSPVEVECCISRTLIRTLINYGEIQQLLPKNWKLAGEDDPTEVELPQLPQTEEVEEQAGTLRAGEALVVWQRLVELKAQYEVLPVATLAKGLVGESYLVKAEELALLTGHRRPLVRRE
jgi:hypothetical protein